MRSVQDEMKLDQAVEDIVSLFAEKDAIPNNGWWNKQHEVQTAMVGLMEIQDLCHGLARKSGWWEEFYTMPSQYRKHFIACKIALVHSEASEMLEGVRKNLMDDHLPHRQMGEVEAADVIIRLLDLAGAMGWDIAGAVIEKLAYNQQRADHKPDARAADDGKAF